MFNKKTLIVLSAFALAACSSTERGVNLSGEEFSVSPIIKTKNAGKTSGYDYANQSATKEVLELRRDMAATSGDRVRFGYDSAALTPEAQKALRNVATYITKHQRSLNNVVVEGHADERGTREYNLALGDRRAVAVKKFLVGAGVPAKLLSTVSYGKENPEDNAHTSEAWAKNRRGVLVLN